MRVTLIAAMDENRLIGTGEGGLPWKGIERDKAHFREFTKGKALLLGRQTFEEMIGWFDVGHRPVVVSREAGYRAESGFPVAASVEEGIALAEARGEEELVVCGGATIYELALPLATDLVLTIVHERSEVGDGGACFPEWEGLGFEEEKREWFGAGDGCGFGLTFLWLER
jgi:dihydrofolate reductase